jgi:hypothetical protein
MKMIMKAALPVIDGTDLAAGKNKQIRSSCHLPAAYLHFVF